jgi:hypothetical protein
VGVSLFGSALGLGTLGACGSQKNGPAAAPDGGTADAGDGASGEGAVERGPADASDGGPGADAKTEAAAETGADAPTEAAVEASSCTGVMCAGQCLQAADCRSCTGAPLLCGATGTCVAACASCQDAHDAALPIDCFACDSNHQNPIGTCQPADAGSYCLSGDYLGQYQGGPGYQCGCGTADSCPGATQVCVPLGNRGAAFCLTCGESTVGQIQGQPCKDGGTCQASQALCQ